MSQALRLACLPRAGYLFVAPAVLVIAGLGLWVALSGVAYLRGVDLNAVYTLQKTLGGLPLYTDTAAIPFDVAQYAPLYYLVVLALAKWLGVAADAPAALLAIARGLSFVCAVALSLGVYFVARRRLDLTRAAAGVVAGLSFVLTSPWFFLARPDAMAALLALASLAVVVGPSGRPGPARLLASALLVVAAIYTKQSEIQVAAVLVVYVAWTGGWRSAAGLIAGIVLAGAGALAVCASLWPHFIANVVGGVDNGLSVVNLLTKTLQDFIGPQAVLIGLSGLAVLEWAREPVGATRRLFLVAVPLLFAAAVVLGLKQGSAENYFVEFTVVALLASATFLCRGGATGDAGGRVLLSGLVGLVLLVALPVWTLNQAFDYWYSRIERRVSLVTPVNQVGGEKYRALARRLDPAVLGTDGYVLAVPLAINLEIPRSIVVPQKEVAALLHANGVVEYDALAELVATRRLRYIVGYAADHGIALNPFLGVSFDDYVPQETVGEFTIFVPREPR